jgi:hypothetical protein
VHESIAVFPSRRREDAPETEPHPRRLVSRAEKHRLDPIDP